MLSLVLITIIVVLFLLNSTETIKWVVDRYTPVYGFGYSQISGGLLTGLEVKDLSYQNDKLAASLRIGWNIIPLIYSRVAITHTDVTDANVDHIKKMIASFTSEESSDEPDDNSSFVMPVSISVSQLHLSLKPFDQSGIKIKALDLNGKDILYHSDTIEAKRVLLTADTNITTLQIAGEIEERVVKVKKLKLLDIDTVALIEFINALSSNEDNTQAETTTKSSTAKNTNSESDQENQFIPTRVDAENIQLTIKPLSQPQYRVEKAELNGSSIGVNIERILQNKPNAIEVGALTLQLESNLTQLSLEAKLVQERVTLNNLSLHQIDTLALTKIFASDTNNTNQESDTLHKEQVKSSESNNPLIPKELFVQRFDCSIKSATYQPVAVESVELNGSKIIFDIPKLLAKEGDIDINVSTNFATLIQNVTIFNNQLKSHGSLNPLKKLYETYKIPLKDEAIATVPIEIDANQEQADISVVIDGKNLLQAKEGSFNVEALHLSTKVHYLIAQSDLRVESEGNISTPYTKNVKLHNLLRYKDDKLEYAGKIILGELKGIDANYTEPLNNLLISYNGDISSLSAHVDSDGLRGKLISPDFNKAEFNLTTKSPLLLNDLVTLPKPLHKAVADLNIHIPLDFNQITPLKADALISSNIANIDAKFLYGKNMELNTTTTLPPNTLLKGFGKEINFKMIETIQTNLILAGQNIRVDMSSQAINSNLKLNMESKDLSGNLKIVDTDFIFGGNLDNNISLNHQATSLQAIMNNIHSLYAFDPIDLDGDIKLSVVANKLKDISLRLDSKKLLYKADRITSHELDNTALSLRFSDGNLTLNNYTTTFQKQKIFATKPSRVTLKESNITISPLWLNDELKMTGSYDLKSQKGLIVAYANPFNISHELIDLSSKIDIRAILENNETDVKGTVTLLGGELHIDMDKKSFASDSDIIIMQNLKKKKQNTFMDNLSTNIKINTDKPLRYKTQDADIYISTDLLAQKSKYDSLLILGTANIKAGSYYRLQKKKFVFKKSIIAFIGDMNKPILDLRIVYNSINYEISIQVTGDPQTPNIIFSSIPHLSKEQILSVILFDSKNAGDGSSGDEMMKMMGGAMAKSVLSNIGIKIDHLSIGTDGSMEIGKKISEKVTIIYANDEVSTAKIQYDYDKNIKAVISSDGESSGADIIYKREF